MQWAFSYLAWTRDQGFRPLTRAVEGKVSPPRALWAALIGANLISIEDHVEIDSLIAWRVETVEVGSRFPLKHILADWLGVAITPLSQEWNRCLGERVSKCLSSAEPQLFPNKADDKII